MPSIHGRLDTYDKQRIFRIFRTLLIKTATSWRKTYLPVDVADDYCVDSATVVATDTSGVVIVVVARAPRRSLAYVVGWLLGAAYEPLGVLFEFLGVAVGLLGFAVLDDVVERLLDDAYSPLLVFELRLVDFGNHYAGKRRIV